jgi:signal transduction histidine kinase
VDLVIMEERYDIRKTTRRRVFLYFTVAFAMILFFFLMRKLGWQGSHQTHTIMEVIATILALIVGSFSLVHYYSNKDTLFLFLGAAYIGTGVLDGYHAIITSSWVVDLVRSSLSHVVPWSWNASRFFLGFMMTIAWISYRRENIFGKKGAFSEAFIYLGTGLIALGFFIFFFYYPLPEAYSLNSIVGRPAEFIAAFFFGVALLGFWRKGEWRTSPIDHWIMISLVMGFVIQAIVMPFSQELFDPEFFYAHLLKKLSYIAMLVGLFYTMYNLFRMAKITQRGIENEVLLRTQEIYESQEAIISAMDEVIKSNRFAEQQTERLERANKELEQFAYIASHDLQAPVRHMSTYAQILSEDYKDSQDENFEKYLGYISKGAAQMRNLISGLLEFSKTGRNLSHFESVDLNKVVNDVLINFEEQTSSSGVKIEVAQLHHATIDEVLISLVFQNLIENALKFKDINRELLITITSEIDEEFIIVSIKDTGIGMKQEYEDKIFNIFQRLNNKEEFEGSGIGLSLVKKVVGLHGGNIWVETELGKGSTFHFSLLISGKEEKYNEEKSV